MKHKILNILKRLGVESIRTKNIVRHVFVSFFYKGGAVLATFLLVPLTIDFLETENYGVWLTLSSFIAWFSFFDIGLGNGLRNRLTEAKTNGNMELARAYVSTAYFTIATISIILFLLFFSLNFFIDWANVFNANEALNGQLRLLMPILFGSFCLQLVIKLIGNIYLADQEHSIQVKIHFIIQVLSVTIIYVLIKTSESSLLTFGIIFSSIPLIVLLGLNFFGFANRFKDLKPSFSLWHKKYLNDIMGIGFEFFIIQISVIVLFSTDNFIISKLFSPEEVVPYNIAFKYFSILTMLFNIIIMPYWSSFTEAYVKKDYNWIRKSINSLLKIWLVIPFLLLIMLFISNWFYNLWVGQDVIVPFMLSVAMAIYVLFFTFNMIFNFFINGVGKIRIQMVLSIISMIINIPLSIVFVKVLNLGLSGVILATTVSIVGSVILYPLQYYKIINLKAKGIWNR